MYRLVFCDYDGTLARAHSTDVRPAVRAAMQAVVDANLWITVCTSRGYQLVKPLLYSVVVNAPLVCCNGGLIADAYTRHVHVVKPLPLDLARDLIELSEREGIAMWFYLADMITLLEKRIGDASFVLRRDGVTLRHVRDPVAELCTPPHKVLVETASPSQDAATIAQVQACVGDRARVLASSPMRIDVLVPGVCKSWAMSWVAEHLGVQQEETIGIGDADNDVEMVEWAGLGIAMGNGTPAVRAAADWIAPPLEADGVAAALRRFALSR